MAKYFVSEKTAAWIREKMAERENRSDIGASRQHRRGGSVSNDYPLPFEIFYSDSEESWIIWLPEESIVADYDFDTALHDDLTASTEYGDGFYILDSISAGQSWTGVYLDCWVTGEGTATTPHAEITTSPSAHSGASEEHIALIANVKATQNGAKYVQQIMSGLITFGSGSGIVNDLTADSDSAAMSGRNSVEIDQQTGGPKYISLYQFEKTARPMTMAMTAEQESGYYEGTATTITGKYNGNAYCSMLIRKPQGVDPGQSVWELDYATLGVTLPPFVRGDANLTVGHQSIEVVTGYNQRYYQLHNFDTPGTTSKTSDMTDGEDVAINIATGVKADSSANDMVLIRTAGGTLEYRKLLVKGLSETAVTNIAEYVCNNYFSEGGGGYAILERLIEEKLIAVGDGRYWTQGGSASTCYGSSVGNSNKSAVINLDSSMLVGEWSCSGPITATGNLQSSASVVVSDFLQGERLCLGATTLTEAQLIALKSLIA